MALRLRTTTYIDWNVYSITNIKGKYGFRVKLIYGKNDIDIQQYSGFKTKRDAESKRNEIIAKLTNNTYVVYKNVNVKDYFTYWLEEVMKSKITYNTYMSYRNIVNNYIIKKCGSVKMTSLNQTQIRELYNTVSAKSESVVRLVKTVMNIGLRYAVQRNIISVNVALGINLPKQIKKKPYRQLNIDSSKTLTVEQVKRLIEASRNTPIHLQIMFATLMGLRISEINALKYSDIDYVNRKIYVERQLGKDINKDNDDCVKKTVTKQEIKPKTRSSKRWVDIPDILFEEILNERKIYEKHRKRRINDKTCPFKDDDYICCSTYGNSRSKGFHSRYFKNLLKDNGLPNIRFHDLRHTFTTLLLKANFSSKAVSTILGHASEIVTVDVYCNKDLLIYDCLGELEPYIEKVKPKEDATLLNDLSTMDLDNYFKNITANLDNNT